MPVIFARWQFDFRIENILAFENLDDIKYLWGLISTAIKEKFILQANEMETSMKCQ